MIAAEVLDALLSAGATAEMIVAAVKADAAKDALALETKRTKDRERQRRHRLSRDVTVTECDIADNADRVSLDKEIPPRPPKEINPIPCVRLAREGRFHRIPEGWQPTKSLPAELQAKVDIWPPGALPDEIAALKRWAANAEDKNGKGRKLDWDKALWNWLGRRHDEQYSRVSARQSSGGSKSLAGAAAAFGHPSTWSEDRAF